FGEQDAGSHNATSGIYQNTSSYSYKTIARANLVLNNIDRTIDVIDAEKYSQIQDKALVTRADYTMYLTSISRDVLLILEPNTSTEEALIPRSPKSEVVDRILSDLQTAAGILPNKWSDSGYGRITKGAALALSARIALYNERYDIAAQSANLVIQSAG